MLNILELTREQEIERRILPVVFGDCLYHIYEIYNEVSREKGDKGGRRRKVGRGGEKRGICRRESDIVKTEN